MAAPVPAQTPVSQTQPPGAPSPQPSVNSPVLSIQAVPAKPVGNKKLAAQFGIDGDPNVYPFKTKVRWDGYNYRLSLDIPCENWRDKNPEELKQVAQKYADLFFADLSKTLEDHAKSIDPKGGKAPISPGDSFEILFKGEEEGYTVFVSPKGFNPLTATDEDIDQLEKVVHAKSEASKTLARIIEMEDPKEMLKELTGHASLSPYRKAIQKKELEKLKEISPVNLQNDKNSCFLNAAFQQLVNDPLLTKALENPQHFDGGEDSDLYAAIQAYQQLQTKGGQTTLSLAEYLKDDTSQPQDVTDGWKILKKYFKEPLPDGPLKQAFEAYTLTSSDKNPQLQSLIKEIEIEKDFPEILSLDIPPPVEYEVKPLKETLSDLDQTAIFSALTRADLAKDQERIDKISQPGAGKGWNDYFHATPDQFEDFKQVYRSFQTDPEAQAALCRIYFRSQIDQHGATQDSLFLNTHFNHYLLQAAGGTGQQAQKTLKTSKVARKIQIDPSGDFFVDSKDQRTAQYEIASFGTHSGSASAGHYVTYVHQGDKYYLLDSLRTAAVLVSKEEFLTKAQNGSFFMLHKVNSAESSNLGRNEVLKNETLQKPSVSISIEKGRLRSREMTDFTLVHPTSSEDLIHPQARDLPNAAQIAQTIQTDKASKDLAPRGKTLKMFSHKPKMVWSQNPKILHLPLEKVESAEEIEQAVHDVLTEASSHQISHLAFPLLKCANLSQDQIEETMHKAIRSFFQKEKKADAFDKGHIKIILPPDPAPEPIKPLVPPARSPTKPSADNYGFV